MIFLLEQAYQASARTEDSLYPRVMVNVDCQLEGSRIIYQSLGMSVRKFLN